MNYKITCNISTISTFDVALLFLSAVIFIIRAVIFSTTRSLTTCSLWGSCLICSANNQSIIIKRLLLMWKSFFACDPITELGNRAFFFQVANREHGKQMFFILSGCLSGYRRKMAPDRNGLEPWFKMACPARFELATSWFVVKRSIQLSYGQRIQKE